MKFVWKSCLFRFRKEIHASEAAVKRSYLIILFCIVSFFSKIGPLHNHPWISYEAPKGLIAKPPCLATIIFLRRFNSWPWAYGYGSITEHCIGERKHYYLPNLLLLKFTVTYFIPEFNITPVNPKDLIFYYVSKYIMTFLFKFRTSFRPGPIKLPAIKFTSYHFLSVQ